jgi:hypothetical protein
MSPRVTGLSRPLSWRTVVPVALGLVVLFVIGCATGRGQPHMTAALDHLRSAQSELQSAATDKGGHRTRALELVDQAIGEVNAGVDYAAARH